MLSRHSEDAIWSRFVFELVIWPQQITLARWTQPSGPLCLWQCLPIYTGWRWCDDFKKIFKMADWRISSNCCWLEIFPQGKSRVCPWGDRRHNGTFHWIFRSQRSWDCLLCYQVSLFFEYCEDQQGKKKSNQMKSLCFALLCASSTASKNILRNYVNLDPSYCTLIFKHWMNGKFSNLTNTAHNSRVWALMFSFLQIEIIYEHQNWGVERSLSFSEWKHVVALCNARGPEFNRFNYIWSYRIVIQCIAIVE